MMYAVKTTNLYTNADHYTPARDYVAALDTYRNTIREAEENGWEAGTDYTIEVVEVESEFDFENQPDWN